jgi:hypothetical protein
MKFGLEVHLFFRVGGSRMTPVPLTLQKTQTCSVYSLGSTQNSTLTTLRAPSVPGPRGSIRCVPTHARRATAARGSSVVNGFDFEGYLSRNAKAVHDALDTALTGPDRLVDSMRYSVLAGGKRVRSVRRPPSASPAPRS